MRNAMNMKRKMTMATANGERCNHSVNREQSKDDERKNAVNAQL